MRVRRHRDDHAVGHQLERDGQDTKVVLPYFRARKVAVMTLRSQAEIDALAKQSGGN